MKKLLFILFALCSFNGFSQIVRTLSNVSNTTDSLKPVSNAMQAALTLKVSSANPTFTGTVTGVTATAVGLGNVNNTTDSLKPVSRATITALGLKQNALSGTGIVRIAAGTISYDASSYLTSITSANVTTALGFAPYNATNPSGYISSVPAQTFASITLKPTTILGYGITDAYPLIGNPSAFLTSITSSNVTTALGYVPYNATNFVAGTNYLAINGNGSALTGITGSQVTGNIAGTSSNITGIAAIANGGTGSASQNFVDLTTAQTILGNKTFSGTTLNFSASGTTTIGTSGQVSVNSGNATINIGSDPSALGSINIGTNTTGNRSINIGHINMSSSISLTTSAGAVTSFKQGAVEKMRVHTNGFIGINNSIPAYTLDVVGTGNFTGALAASNLSNTNTGDETTASVQAKLGIATTLVGGYLTATDWNTFNNKQPLLGFTPYNATNPSGYIALTGLSSTATGLTYTNTTGALSLTAGYIIPTSAQLATYLLSTTAATTYSPIASPVHTGDIETTTVSAGVIVKSPNGTRFRLSVSNTGDIIATSL